MSLVFLILMIGIPIAEIAVFIEAGEAIGLWPTIAVIILTAVIGAYCLRYQGLGVLNRVFQSINNHQLPVREMFDGLCLLFAGALLITPGFITDTVGFTLLIPPFRQALAALIAQHLIKSGRIHTAGPGADPRTGPYGTHPSHPGGPVIDGEFDEITPLNEQIPPKKPDNGPNAQ